MDEADEAGTAEGRAAAGGALEGVVDRLEARAGDGALTVGDVAALLEDRSLGLVLALLGLVALIPVVGAIPGVSIGVGLLSVVAVVQWVIGGGRMPLPRRLARRGIETARAEAGIEKARPWARRIDRVLRPRLGALTGGRGPRTALALGAALLGLSMLPLALVPFGVTLPAAGIVAIGLGLMTRDGIAALAGLALAAGTLALGLWLA